MTKEVRFDTYCPLCKHYEKNEAEDPCFDCLNQGWNEDSHQPICYEENEDESGGRKEKKAYQSI